MDSPTRRSILTMPGTALGGGLAGCTGSDSPDGGSTPAEGTPTEGAATGPTLTEETPTASNAATSMEDGELDFREANVMGVTVGARSDGSVDFDVTLHHDDDGEDGYANWWQVETLAGERLGRRDLLHAHSNQPFTRSANIEIPADVDCVVVRGHDETHGYGGQAMVISIETGATRIVKQGSSKESLSSVDCPGAE